MEDVVEGTARELQRLAADYSGWRFGRGGSGHWWAVRRNDCLRALNREDLEVMVREHIESRKDG